MILSLNDGNDSAIDRIFSHKFGNRFILFTLCLIAFYGGGHNENGNIFAESFSAQYQRTREFYYHRKITHHQVIANFVSQHTIPLHKQGLFATSNSISTSNSNANSNSTLIKNSKRTKRGTDHARRYKNPRFESHKRSRPQHSYSSDSHYAKFSSNNKRQTIKRMFREAKNMERIGRWQRASQLLSEILIIEPKDAHSHLALARLQSRREQNPHRLSHESAQSPNTHNPTSDKQNKKIINNSNEKSDTLNPYPKSAREAYSQGTKLCPKSIHLWQAWAIYEQELGNFEKANDLFEKALRLDSRNPYVCHAYGLMQQKSGNIQRAQELWEQSLEKHSTAALVCSLGELYASSGNKVQARQLYAQNVPRLKSERERTEVYLAAAWLEERHFSNLKKGHDLIQSALKLSPKCGRAHVALLRLEDRLNKRKNRADVHANASDKKGSNSITKNKSSSGSNNNTMRKRLAELCSNSAVEDGRLFNAWASLEVKDGRLEKARHILKEGMRQFPQDQSLVQAAGKVEERRGKYSTAKEFYSASLLIEPSAPTLVAIAMLELRHPPPGKNANITMVRRLFDEALLLDPRHGPVYNAYGNMELRYGNIDDARAIYDRGVQRNCTDVASVYHGYAKFELSQGNVEKARSILERGLEQVERQEGTMLENAQRGRSIFLAHTLGMLELNSQNIAKAKRIFASGLKRHGGTSQLLLGAALCEVRLGNEERARLLFEQAVHADEKHAHAWQSWGVMEMRAGNFVTAKMLFECGIKSNPKHGALWQAYATMESRMGNFETARALFAAGVRKCPKHVPLYQAWACLELRGENYDQAKRLIGEALTRNKREGSGWLVAAKVEEKIGNHGLSMMLLRRGLQYAPNHPEIYCALANQEVRIGKINEARALLEKGLEVDPHHAPLYHSLAELEARVFNLEGLANLNKRAATVFNSNALIPPEASSTQAWSKKMAGKLSTGSQQNLNLPNGVTALMEKVGLDLEESETSSVSSANVDPTKILENMMMLEDGVIGDMWSNYEEEAKEEDSGENKKKAVTQKVSSNNEI